MANTTRLRYGCRLPGRLSRDLRTGVLGATDSCGSSSSATVGVPKKGRPSLRRSNPHTSGSTMTIATATPPMSKGYVSSSPAPSGDEADHLLDLVVAAARTPTLFELKRGRTTRPAKQLDSPAASA